MQRADLPPAPRSAFLDYNKGILILLVCIGHASQMLFNKPDEQWDDPLFRFIYWFHMPAFMLIAGHLNGSSMGKHSIQTTLKNRLRAYLLPCLSWSILFGVVSTLSHKARPIDLPMICLQHSFKAHWFLWALLTSILSVSILDRLFTARPWAAALLLLVTPYLPETLYIPLLKYCLPYFLLGYCLARSGSALSGRIMTLAWLGLPLGLMMGHSWNWDTFVYNSGSPLDSSHLKMLTLRYATSLLLCAGLWQVSKHAFSRTPDRLNHALQFVGRHSLTIFLVQGYLYLSLTMTPLPKPEMTVIGKDIAASLMGILVTCGSLCIGWILENNQWTALFLLGKAPHSTHSPAGSNPA